MYFMIVQASQNPGSTPLGTSIQNILSSNFTNYSTAIREKISLSIAGNTDDISNGNYHACSSI